MILMLVVVVIRPNVCFDHVVHNIEFRDYRSSKPHICIVKTLLYASHHIAAHMHAQLMKHAVILIYIIL